LTIKNKLDIDLKYALALKWKVNTLFSLTASTQVDLSADNIFDKSKTFPVPFGVQFEFNI